MNKTRPDYITYGFKGTYFELENVRKAIIIVMGDRDDDIMNKAASRWLTSNGINALSLSLITEPGEKRGIHSWPLERIEKAVSFLEVTNDKVGILGISMQSTLALAASSLIPGISLVIAFAPADFVPWGFYQGKLGKWRNAEWPSGSSTFSYRGKDLPYLKPILEGEAYYQHYLDEKDKWHEIHTESFFTGAEKEHGLSEDEMIRGENINGDLILIGSKDDSMWQSDAYIERISRRLENKGFRHEVKTLVYDYGTHLLLPESMLRKVLPFGIGLIYRMYNSGKVHSREIGENRLKLDRELISCLKSW